MKPFHPTDLRFRCPKCGGSSFGSTLDASDPLGPMQRFCHGNDAGDGMAGCLFTWPDKADWKYFLLNGVNLTQKEHEAVEAKIRETPGIGMGHPDDGSRGHSPG